MFWYHSEVSKEAHMYLGWYDADKKKTPEQKLIAAIERYEMKWGRKPQVALVNAADIVELPGIAIRAAAHVPPSTFFVGEDEPVEELAAA
jgi:hypothetical protein